MNIEGCQAKNVFGDLVHKAPPSTTNSVARCRTRLPTRFTCMMFAVQIEGYSELQVSRLWFRVWGVGLGFKVLG